jgi:Flp pilus assembly protein TadD
VSRYQQAIPILSRVKTLFPNNISILSDLASAAFHVGQVDLALQTYQRFLELSLTLRPGSWLSVLHSVCNHLL